MIQLPVEERPRERLLAQGAEHLSATELLAILLCSGTKGKSVLVLAQEMLFHFNGTQGLLDATIEEMMEIKGIGKAKAIQLKAALGLARKCFLSVPLTKTAVESPQQAYEMIREKFDQQSKEMLAVILRDARGRAFFTEVIAVGTLSEVLVHPREIFYPAVRHQAKSLIVCHNHPSGDPTPSPTDVELTRLLLCSSKVMGIHLDDHLIIAEKSFMSFWERGLIPRAKRY